jgi:hypothetical protein
VQEHQPLHGHEDRLGGEGPHLLLDLTEETAWVSPSFLLEECELQGPDVQVVFGGVVQFSDDPGGCELICFHFVNIMEGLLFDWDSNRFTC